MAIDFTQLAREIAGEDLTPAYEIMKLYEFDDYDFLLYSVLVRFYKGKRLTFMIYDIWREAPEVFAFLDTPEEVERRLERMASTLITVDLTDRFRKVTKCKDGRMRVRGSMINFSAMEVEIDGTTLTIFTLTSEPLLRMCAFTNSMGLYKLLSEFGLCRIEKLKLRNVV